ncbi:MAG: hypothetical protein ACP5RH_20365 [Leptodesmis sp.]|uniref:hypothetical protein n=1 Tax=Leptodesmis sp. TaxID=3100501 RepID=UPI003D09D7ED
MASSYGKKPRLTVEFADRSVKQLDIDQLAEFVTEQQNPANVKHAVRVFVELPSPRLNQGLVFVDTPGLGSLATAGAEETLAYLLIARHHQLAEQSIRRKIGGLREAVIARLQRCLGQTQGKLAYSSAQCQSAKADLQQAIAQFETTRITCERLIDEIGQLTPAAIARAASEVINGWLSGRDKMPDPGDRIKSVLIRVSAEKATELQAQLNTLAVSLFQTLTHLGQILEAETIPTKEEFTHCIREMPPMDIATLYVGLRRSFLLLLNKQIAEYQVEKSLQQQIGNTVTETFQAYRKLLQIWTAKILSNLQYQFDNYADPYRANLEQESGDVVSNELEKAILQQDLDKLIRWNTSNETSVTPCYPTLVERLNV